MNGRISESGKAAISSYIGSRSDRGPGVVGRSRLRSNGVLSAGSPETKKPSRGWVFVHLAESQGFEPWVPLRVQRISNPSRSTTPATLQVGAHDSSFAAADKALRQGNTEPLRHFFVGFDNAAQPLAEAVLVHLLTGFLVPQAAAVGAEFVAQYNFALEQAELQLEVHQQQAGIVKQLLEDVVDLEGQLAHALQLFGGGPAEGNHMGFVDEGVALGVILEEQLEGWRSEFAALFDTQALDQAAGGVVTHDAFHGHH